MRTKQLTISAATVVVVSANSSIQYQHKNNNDPNRRISPAETISKRSKNNNRLRSLRGLKQRNDNGADDDNIIISSSSSEQLEGGEEERALNTLDDIMSSSSSSEVAPELKIIGGIPATTDRYPYLVSLTYFGTSICGGSLVSPDMVLTAAHCAGYASAIERGRTDRSVPFNTAKDNFERIEVAYEIKHPGWDVTTVDNDFMLIKLVTNSVSGSLVTLNTDPNVPNLPSEQLTIMGWGDTNSDPDVNEPGISLLQANVEYVPNDICRAKEGVIGTGDFVKYESRLTSNMMCAMDEDGERGDVSDVVDEDTCVGDSGGPMILPPNSGSNGLNEDLQVGLVSWGIGCASPIFPGVYARISAQYEWIRRNICRHSNNAPEVYDCDSLGDLDDESGTGVGGGGFPLIEEDPNDDKSYVILEVSLDDRPQEFSWMVSTLSGPTSQLVSTIPPNFYTGYTNYTFHHKLQVNPDSFYRISLRDTFGDGFNGYAAVYRGSIPILSNLIMYEDMFYDADGGTDLKRLDHAFYTGKEPQNFFTLAIKFDKFPKDTWWKLESTTDNVILAQRPPGWYNERFELMSIVEEIPVFGVRPDGVDPEYRFTIGDSYPCDNNPTETCGDGICCNYGEGKFELFAGPIEDNLLLTSGGEYELTQSVLVNAPASFSVQ